MGWKRAEPRLTLKCVDRRTRFTRALPRIILLRYSFVLEVPMPGPVVCAMCDMPEARCTCEKYCTICKGQHDVRLGADGLYYCPDCREACDVPLANDRGK